MGVFAILAGVGFCQGLSPQPAVVTDLDGEPTGITEPGQEFLFHVPVTNVTSNTLSDIVGVAVPLGDGMKIIDPVSDYGSLSAGATADGTPFRGLLEAGAQVRRSYEFKVGLKSDEGQQDHVISLQGSTGFGNGMIHAAWPTTSFGSGTIAVDAAADATELQVESTAGLLGGTLYKNLRTNELIHVRAIEPDGTLLVKRGQFGNVNPAPILAGDALVYEGVPIPDAVAAGLAFRIPVEVVPGPIGNIRVNVESIIHPRVGDLMITVEDGATTPVIVMGPLEGGMASGADIIDVSFSDSATTTAEAQTGRLAPGEYRPYESFSTIANTDGTSVTGWTFRVSDIVSPTVGYIKGGWSIEPAP